jgi:hypothetical protein
VVTRGCSSSGRRGCNNGRDGGGVQGLTARARPVQAARHSGGGGMRVKGGAATLIGDARAVRTGEGSAGRRRYGGRQAAGARTYGNARSGARAGGQHGLWGPSACVPPRDGAGCVGKARGGSGTEARQREGAGRRPRAHGATSACRISNWPCSN